MDHATEGAPAEPVREKRFSFEHVDPGGARHSGVFFYRRPTLRDLLRIEAERQRLCEGQTLDREFAILAAMLARLKVVLPEVPRWLRWDEVDDLGLLTRLNEEVDRLEGSWFRGDDAARGGAEPGAPARARADGAVPAAPLVDAEVQPSGHER